MHYQVVKIDVGGDGATAPLSNSNPVPVSDAGGSLTVDGTVTVQDGGGAITVDGTVAATQSGTWNVQPGNTAYTTAWLVTGTGGTFPVTDSGGSLTVDGTVTANLSATDNAVLDAIQAATEATQAAVEGTLTVGAHAVTDGGGSLTVDGAVAATQSGAWSVRISDGTDTADVLDLTSSNPLAVAIVDGDGAQITSFGGGVQYTEGATDASITGTAILWEDSSDTLATVSAASPLPVEIVAGAGSGGTASADDADFTAGSTSGTPAMGVYESSPSSVTDGDMGIVGITQTRALRVSVDNSSIPVTDNGGSLTVDGTVAISGTVAVTDNSGSLTVDNGGTFAVQAAQSGTWNVGTVTTVTAVTAISNALPAGNNNIGDVDVASIAAGTNNIGNVGLIGRTSGGLSIFRSLDLDESEEDVKTSAGQLYFIHAINLANAVRYLKFYNATAANVTVGTTTPVLTFPIPSQGDTNGAGFTVSIPQGFAFGTAISAAATTGLADNDTGAPGANEVIVNLGYV